MTTTQSVTLDQLLEDSLETVQQEVRQREREQMEYEQECAAALPALLRAHFGIEIDETARYLDFGPPEMPLQLFAERCYRVGAGNDYFLRIRFRCPVCLQWSDEDYDRAESLSDIGRFVGSHRDKPCTSCRLQQSSQEEGNPGSRLLEALRGFLQTECMP